MQLLGLLDAHALEPDVVLLAAPALARVLMGAREAALEAMWACNALAVLSGVVTRQQRAHAAAQVRPPSYTPVVLTAGGRWHVIPPCLLSGNTVCWKECLEPRLCTMPT